MGGTENVEYRRNKVVIATVIYKETDSKHYSLYKWYIAVRYEMILRIMKYFALRQNVKQNSFLILRRHISYLRSKSHPAESRQITSSLFTVTSYFKKILIKGKRQVKSEEVISKKSSFLRMRIFWRREWDSNPRDVAVTRFSRKLGFVSPRRSYFISDSMAVHSKSFSTPFLSSLSISCSLYCKKLILQ